MRSFSSLWRGFLLAAILFSGAASLARAAEPVLALFDADSPIDSLRAQGVELARSDDGALLVKNGENDSWPGVHLTGEWDLRAYKSILLDVQSTSDEPITLYCRVDCADVDMATLDGAFTREISLKPGERANWRVELPNYLNVDVRKSLFAMRGKPGGIATDAYSKDVKIPFDKRKVIAIRPFENQNKRGDSWKLYSISVDPYSEQELDRQKYLNMTPDEFFPMIDQFGQFKHGEWPGKTHSLNELRAQIAQENVELGQWNPVEFDEYGGWLNGPQLEATGSFRTEKIDGRWTLVDPAGRLFWSNGVDCVGFWSGTTPTTDRERYFDPTTPMTRNANSPLAQFVGSSSNSINNYYAGRGEYKTFNFSASNLYLKYGDDWREQGAKNAVRRLRSWGINTIANWSDVEIIRGAKTPYVTTVGVTGGTPYIEGSSGYWGKFPDPFDPQFAKRVRDALAQCSDSANDPFCVGYFVDNEISWGDKGSLAKAALASPKSQCAKIAFVERLQAQYETIEKLNASWETEFESWDALLAEPFKAGDQKNLNADCDAFYLEICRKYFSEISAGMREKAPKKLYLGCRFAWTNDLARKAAQEFCDVVSYNFYKRDVSDFKPVEGVDKPVMIGEFHFGALDRGLFHPGLVLCRDQIDRAQSYEQYLRGALANPWIVGAHWFQYQDEPTTGRFDGENYQIGFVDVCDRPYPEIVAASRRVGYNMYQIRENSGARTK